MGFRVTKAGYYPTRGRHDFYFSGQFLDKEMVGNRTPKLNFVLKKIGKPIPMYAKHEEVKVQKEDEPIGFDLSVGDWVAPLGVGKSTDLIFTVHRKIINGRAFEGEVKLTFPNKGDGIMVAPPESDGGSDLKTSRSAMDTGYEDHRVWRYSSASGGPAPVFGYFIRVRTVLDESGQVRSALYGKIRGDLRFYAGMKVSHAGIGFDFYLNPNPNDRNVEFDPQQNILKGLKPTEEVKQP